MSSCCAFCKKRYLYVRLPLYRARCAPRFRRREALRARGPRRCFRTPSPSQDRGGGLPLVLRGRPAPARPRGSPAAGRTEAAGDRPPAAVRGSSSGKQKVLLSGAGTRSGGPGGRGRRRARAAAPSALPAPDPAPHARAGGISHCSGLGRARGRRHRQHLAGPPVRAAKTLPPSWPWGWAGRKA